MRVGRQPPFMSSAGEVVITSACRKVTQGGGFSLLRCLTPLPHLVRLVVWLGEVLFDRLREVSINFFFA